MKSNHYWDLSTGFWCQYSPTATFFYNIHLRNMDFELLVGDGDLDERGGHEINRYWDSNEK